ncbi:isochorismatase family cysteine hydrolase [Shouchella lonarensis]|uniref:Nicotinamidase-related amidase n=1 Tax=Shouchella lonarensis TaxID=1464122 RepID=A0A1G6H2H8_9BACI|nr:isochorismatase family cysteine hydrolase [Shouchella lonarensis]SDB88489.1 Nicotinamidase-related amidase [Shouchella lonarensis]
MTINRSNDALLIIDMINPFSFHHAEQLYPFAEKAAYQIALLKNHMKKRGRPVIYVNDHYERWQAEFTTLVHNVIDADAIGSPLAKILMPCADDLSVMKPKFSGFFATPLHLLLEHLKVDTLILTGIVGNMCVLFTANDAYTLEYELIIPRDAIACFSEEDSDHALHHFKHLLKANISPINTWL